MISAFGIEHTVSKSFTKLLPKLSRAAKSIDAAKATTMDGKLRGHSTVLRLGAGRTGQMPGGRDAYKWMGSTGDKQAAHAMYSSLSRNSRKKRVLP